MYYMIAMALLHLADAISTVGLVREAGCFEANPVMALLLGFGSLVFVVVKFCCGFAMGAFLQYTHLLNIERGKSTAPCLRLTVHIYIIVILWHCICWLQAGGGIQL